jgi:dynamin-like GTPase MGM1, mitochondrial
MSGRLLAAGILPGARRAAITTVRHYHRLPTGGLLRADATDRIPRRRVWLTGNAFHNAVMVRNASFARMLPKLFVKMARIPAMFGGLAIGALAWIQYQAIREFSLHGK